MDNILKVDFSPLINSYLHHAVVNSIISGNVDEEIDGEVLRIKIIESEGKVWTRNERFIHHDNGEIGLLDHGYGQYDYIYRSCEKKDSIVIRIDEIHNKERDAILNLVISADEFEENIRNSQKTYKIGIMDGHILSRHETQFVIHKAIRDQDRKYIRLTRNENIIESSISSDGVEWIVEETVEADFLDCNAKIGIIAENLTHSSYKDEYWNWLCMNYIQIGYNPHDIGGVFFDYKMFPTKKCRYEYVYACHFLDVSYVEPAEVIDLAENIKSYIDWGLRNNSYLSVSVDEYYVLGRSRYHKEHFFHHNLFYGYDGENKKYLVMGYDTHLSFASIMEDEFEKAIETLQGVIMRYKFEKNNYSLELSISKLISELECFLNSTNSSQSNMLQEEGIYGINAIKELCNSSEGCYHIQHDNRISYLLYEHSVLMQKRMQYIEKKCQLNFSKQLVDLSDSIVMKTKYLKNLVIKNQLKNFMYEDQILDMVQEVHDAEYTFYNEFITQLRRFGDDR